MTEQSLFKWRHFESEIILLCVRWYLRYALSYRDLEAHDARTGSVCRSYDDLSLGPTLRARTGETLSNVSASTTTDSWRVDETYIKVKGVWTYLYRAVDSQGNTLEFLLSPTRDAEAAKRFFSKTLAASHTVEPRVITVDKNAASPKAFQELKADGTLAAPCELRQSKYLNNLIEQDHRFIKRLTRPGMGFFSFKTAWKTLQGFETMNMIRKGQVQGVAKGDVGGQVALVAKLFGVVV